MPGRNELQAVLPFPGQWDGNGAYELTDGKRHQNCVRADVGCRLTIRAQPSLAENDQPARLTGGLPSSGVGYRKGQRRLADEIDRIAEV